jgi:hypothetical protein
MIMPRIKLSGEPGQAQWYDGSEISVIIVNPFDCRLSDWRDLGNFIDGYWRRW